MLAAPPPAVAFWNGPNHWGTLSVAGENSSFRQTVTFDYVQHRGADAPPRWVLHRVTEPNPALRQEDWADSARCPALAEAMRALAGLPGPRFSDPADRKAMRGERVMLDGRDFILEADGGYALPEPSTTTRARVRIESNDGGPLDGWFTELALATDACWALKPPADADPLR